jgi:serine/threonine protein kinase
MLLQPGSTILDGKYLVEALAGKGASAEVYRVVHVSLKTRRAIKVLRRDTEGVGSTSFGDFRRRFELEAQLGAQLNHPNIVHVYDFIEQAGDTLLLVMEYAPGGSLAERLARLRNTATVMPVAEVVGIGLNMADGLAALHARDAVHRDLKPSNILLDAEGRAKIADLGLAQVPGGPSLRSQLSTAIPHPGTPAYMSPEQEKTSAYLTSASDVYALGLMLFEMLTGRAYKNARPGTRASAVRQDVPPALDDLVVRMLAPLPEARPFNGEDVANELRACSIAPAWNKDEAWQRQTLAAAPVVAPVAAVTPVVPVTVPRPRQEPQPIAATEPIAPTPTTTTPAPAPSTAQTTTSPTPKRAGWVLPALSLGVVAALATAVIAALSQGPSQGPSGLSGARATATTARIETPVTIGPPPTVSKGQVPPAEPTVAPTRAPTLEPTVAPTTAPAPTPASTPSSIAQFGGTWRTNFAAVQLTQDGTRVRGTYERYGHNESREIEGTVDGNTLTGFYNGDPSLQFTWLLSTQTGAFDGTWRSNDGRQFQWCGTQSGSLPEGCGFSGAWLSIGDYSVDYPPTIQLVQTGNRVQGTFMNGKERSPGTLNGALGTEGDASHYTLTGQWTVGGFSGTFRWVMRDFGDVTLRQFQGYSVNRDGSRHQWCGWRESSTQPNPCLVVNPTEPTAESIVLCANDRASYDSAQEKCIRTATTFTRPIGRINTNWTFKNVAPGMSYQRRWYRNNALQQRYVSEWDGRTLSTHFAPPGGFAAGTWRLDYYLDGQLAGSVTFVVQ